MVVLQFICNGNTCRRLEDLKLMKLGISTASFFGREHVEATFEILRSMNVDNTEVFLNTFSEYEKAFVEALKERKGEIKVHSLHAHGTCFEPELFSGYDRIRNDAEQIFRKVCYAGFVLGAKYLTFHGPFIKPRRTLNIDFPKFGERLNQLCDIAESYGMYIAYENVNWAYCNNPEFFKNLKQYCPKLKATLDIKQAFFSDVDPYKFLDVMEDRLATVHVCDMDNKLNPMLPLSGRFNFEKFFRELAARTPEAAVFIEVYKDCYRDYDELKDCYDRLNELINKVMGV